MNNGASMSSAIGYIPRDGGDLLPYLKKARLIIEAELQPERDLLESLNRIDEIKALPKGHKYDSDANYNLVKSEDLIDYFPLVFGNEDKTLRLILEDNSLSVLTYLSYKNILDLISRGYISVASVKEAEDDVLLSLKGIGNKKLVKFREANKP